MSPLQIGTIQRPARGERICGDALLVLKGEVTTVAIADGLGHGPEAAKASNPFCAYVEENMGQALPQLMKGAAQALRGTRGAAAAILRIRHKEQSLEFVGVGNIEFKSLSRSAISPFSSPGIVGRGRMRLKVFDYPLNEGDLLVMFSDGISNRFDLDPFAHLPPHAIAERLLDEHGKHHDDATCVVMRL